MTYDWTQLTEKEITNLYLYGMPDTPTDLTDESLIRTAGIEATIEINMASFMAAGPGRFALGSESPLVQAFFSTASDLSWMTPGVEYSKTDVLTQLGLTLDADDRVNIKQVLLSDLAGDYWQRSYIWNSGLFELNDAATFSVDASGNRSIKNYSIRPFQENFDFDGGGLIADIANFVLEPQIDPWSIGRKVNINFVDDGLPTRTYTYADYQADVVSHADHLVLGAAAALTLPAGGLSIINNLWNDGTTRLLYQGKPIIYGTDGAETLSPGMITDLPPILSPLRDYAWANPSQGVALIAGGGTDNLIGGDYADYLQGGQGDDFFSGGKGNDTLTDSEGYDIYSVSPGEGFDTIVDADGAGAVVFSSIGGGTNVVAKGSATDGLDPATWIHTDGTDAWVDQQNGITYTSSVVNGETRLLIHKGDSNVLVKGWSAGELGIELGTGSTPVSAPPPVTDLTVVGDLQPVDFNPTEPGVQAQIDDLGNVIVSGEAAPGREDTLYDSAGNDLIQGVGGNDEVYALNGGDDRIEGGTGQDLLNGGAGNDTLLGGVDSDGVSGNEGNDQIYAENQQTINAAYALGETQTGSGQRGDLLDGGTGDDTLIGEAGNDILLGGLGQDILMGLGGDDTIEGDANVVQADRSWSVTRTVTTVGGVTTYARDYSFYTANREADIGDADVIYGGAGNDWLLAGGANDFVDGGADDDVVFGGAGNDVILGQGGRDVLIGDLLHPSLDASMPRCMATIT